MTTNHTVTFATILLLLVLSGGCAQKQWQDPLGETEEKATRLMLLQEQESRLENCTCCIDAEITATWGSQLYNGGLNGYLQVFLPSSFKLVAINPLGQPLFALTTNGKNFQAINAVKGVYKHGKVSSFVERHSIPDNVFHAEWGKWLTGSMLLSEESLIELRRDAASRGVWLTLKKEKDPHFSKEYLLFDPLRRQLLERVVFDNKGHEAARVMYMEWTKVNGCPLPTSIEVVGQSFGAAIKIELKDILADKTFSADTFVLKLPPGYMQQYYP
jgi:outer membrane lipoprotein-sorting protein